MFKAWQTHGLGQPSEVMRIGQSDLPPLAAGEMRVKVAAACLGLPDYFMCTGEYPATPQQKPFTSGQEVVGTVIDRGDGVKTEIGARVMGMTDFWRGLGSLAEECIVVEDEVNPAPPFIDDAAAASFRIAYHTGYLGVVRNGRAKAGETMLVLGAAGGTGAAAVQLGKAVGVRVIAVAGADDKIAYCRELGADAVIDRRTESVPERVMALTGGKGADLIYDPVGGKPGEEAMGCIAMEGRFLVVGFAAGSWPDIECWHTLGKNCSLVGVYAGRSFGGDVHGQVHNDLMRLYEAGKIRSLTTKTIAFDEVPAALAALPGSNQIGRTVVVL
ncbi:MAG TPA: NADPH:quinone oxidoreductase family protein [Alphaproteobacteria bacterium]|nr:NADPH:quinone oxidoreductase family protein [Alphaproteobacteria bacterium]